MTSECRPARVDSYRDAIRLNILSASSFAGSIAIDVFLCKSFRLVVEIGTAFRPRFRLFQLRGELQKRGLGAKPPHEVSAHRKARGIPMERQADGWLTRSVLHRGKRHVVDQRSERLLRITLVHVKGAKLHRW